VAINTIVINTSSRYANDDDDDDDDDDESFVIAVTSGCVQWFDNKKQFTLRVMHTSLATLCSHVR